MVGKERTFWDINYIVGRKQFEALAWGLLSCGGQLLDSYKHANYSRDTFSVRISLPPDKVETFKIVTRFELTAKPVPDLGMVE